MNDTIVRYSNTEPFTKGRDDVRTPDETTTACTHNVSVRPQAPKNCVKSTHNVWVTCIHTIHGMFDKFFNKLVYPEHSNQDPPQDTSGGELVNSALLKMLPTAKQGTDDETVYDKSHTHLLSSTHSQRTLSFHGKLPWGFSWFIREGPRDRTPSHHKKLRMYERRIRPMDPLPASSRRVPSSGGRRASDSIIASRRPSQHHLEDTGVVDDSYINDRIYPSRRSQSFHQMSSESKTCSFKHVKSANDISQLTCTNLSANLIRDLGWEVPNALAAKDDSNDPCLLEYMPPDTPGLQNSDRIFADYYFTGKDLRGRIFEIDFLYTIHDDIRNLRKLSKYQMEYIKGLDAEEKQVIIELFNDAHEFVMQTILLRDDVEFTPA